MTSLEVRMREELDALLPFPHDAPMSWEDALRRAEGAPVSVRRPRVTRGRAVALALIFAAATLAVLALSAVGGAIAREFGDFSAWLTGSPGEPASEAEQRAFDQANRSWLGFPGSPKLRRLIVTGAAGGTFELFGFRSGDSLCLHVIVKGISVRAGFATGCTPLSELRRADAPAVVSLVDFPFGRQEVPPNEDGFIPARVQVTFGVVADGVSGVELKTNRGDRRDAIVANNVFLAVTEDPPLGLLTHEVTATSDEGDRRAVPFAKAVYAGDESTAKHGEAPGPDEVERQVEGGTIGWLLRREQRGQSIEEAGLAERELFRPAPWQASLDARHARVIKPDPRALAQVVIGLVHVEPAMPNPPPSMSHRELVCAFTIAPAPSQGGGAGCMPIGRLFLGGPFNYAMASGSDQYAWIDGLASDDVARMEAFLASGERIAIPLQDNVFRLEVARFRFPIRVVGYDSEGRVIGIRSEGRDPLSG
jgi:hypothetical protein